MSAIAPTSKIIMTPVLRRRKTKKIKIKQSVSFFKVEKTLMIKLNTTELLFVSKYIKTFVVYIH